MLVVKGVAWWCRGGRVGLLGLVVVVVVMILHVKEDNSYDSRYPDGFVMIMVVVGFVWNYGNGFGCKGCRGGNGGGTGSMVFLIEK